MVWNPESTMVWNPESRKLESGIQRPVSGIQDLYGFSYMGRPRGFLSPLLSLSCLVSSRRKKTPGTWVVNNGFVFATHNINTNLFDEQSKNTLSKHEKRRSECSSWFGNCEKILFTWSEWIYSRFSTQLTMYPQGSPVIQRNLGFCTRAMISPLLCLCCL